MGCDATFTANAGTPKNRVIEILKLLGYVRLGVSPIDKKRLSETFYLPFGNDLGRHSNLTASVMKNGERWLVQTRTKVWRSHRDNVLHNHTLRTLRTVLGGDFQSDEGKNRYFLDPEGKRKSNEAGCYLAACRFRNDLRRMSLVLNVEFKHARPVSADRDLGWVMNLGNPDVALANLCLIQIASLVEAYFRDTFVSLLADPKVKQTFVKPSNVSQAGLLRVAASEWTIERAIAREISFLSVERIVSVPGSSNANGKDRRSPPQAKW